MPEKKEAKNIPSQEQTGGAFNKKPTKVVSFPMPLLLLHVPFTDLCGAGAERHEPTRGGRAPLQAAPVHPQEVEQTSCSAFWHVMGAKAHGIVYHKQARLHAGRT